jgi:hypothetical protein
MGAAKSGDQEVSVGEAFVGCAGKTGFPGFGFFRQGESGAWWSRKRLREEKMQLAMQFAGSKEGGWVYTGEDPRLRNENSG